MNSSFALSSNSAAKMTAEVVPSPTFASRSCASWTKRLAVGARVPIFELVALGERGTVVGDGDVADIVDDHLVESLRT